MEKFNFIIFMVVLIALVFIIGCAKQEIIPEGSSTSQEEVQITSEPPEKPKESHFPQESKESTSTVTNPLNVPRIYSGAHLTLVENNQIVKEEDTPALCYLGAFAMLVLFNEPNLDFSDIVAYSGIGSKAENSPFIGLNNGLKENSIITAASNLGYNFALGVLSEGKASNRPEYDFAKSAKEAIYFKDEKEALAYLKSIIDSGKPVEVHLDTYYVIDDFRKSSPFWVTNWQKAHSSHFMTVTGYDNNYIYINDPTEPDLKIKNMKTNVKNFLEAWKNGANSQIEGARLGPYWTLYLKDKGKRKTVKEIIEWNKELSENSASSIRTAQSYDMIGELGVGRREFGEFLEKNNYIQAGELSKEIADIYFTEPEISKLKEIADKEAQARGLLK